MTFGDCPSCDLTTLRAEATARSRTPETRPVNLACGADDPCRIGDECPDCIGLDPFDVPTVVNPDGTPTAYTLRMFNVRSDADR